MASNLVDASGVRQGNLTFLSWRLPKSHQVSLPGIGAVTKSYLVNPYRGNSQDLLCIHAGDVTEAVLVACTLKCVVV
jgi:hypothetical protein